MSSGSLRLIPAAPEHRTLAVRVGDLVFKKAEYPAEFDQLYKLNHSTFVRELGQYEDDGESRLIDKFDEKNLYLIAKRGTSVIGMLAVHDRPPFSVATRLADPSWIDRTCRWPLEVRLLAIQPEERNRSVLPGLLWSLYRVALAAGYTHLLISGVRQQLRMYRRLGFEACGPEQSYGRASFTPMYIDIQEKAAGLRRLAMRFERGAGLGLFSRRPKAISLLPGPAEVSETVLHAMKEPLLSHRDAHFLERFEHSRHVLREMVGGTDVGLVVGSGTLVNECVAATIGASLGRRPGLILVNGEFGRRLVQQATRWRLRFDVLEWPWSQPWNLEMVDRALKKGGKAAWVWGVHCETSTGLLNDIKDLFEISEAHNTAVCLDCISSLGSVPIDLRRAYLASGVSGKCLGAIAGVGILFGQASIVQDAIRETKPPHQPPVYLDVCKTMATEGPRFTFPSPLLWSLDAALQEYEGAAARAATYQRYAELARAVRLGLALLGGTPLADDYCASPAVTTFAPLLGYSPQHFALLCRSYGFEINALSPHLVERGLVQIATMGNVHVDDCRRLFRSLRQWAGNAG